MPGLAFDALDRHVIAGLGDTVVLATPDRHHTIAELLDASAAIAGGLRMLGLVEGDWLRLDEVDRWRHVVTVLACARLGVFVRDEGMVTVGEQPAIVRTAVGEESWDTVLKAGRNDPASAPTYDPDGLVAHLLDRHGDVFLPLLEARAVED